MKLLVFQGYQPTIQTDPSMQSLSNYQQQPIVQNGGVVYAYDANQQPQQPQPAAMAAVPVVDPTVTELNRRNMAAGQPVQDYNIPYGQQQQPQPQQQTVATQNGWYDEYGQWHEVKSDL